MLEDATIDDFPVRNSPQKNHGGADFFADLAGLNTAWLNQQEGNLMWNKSFTDFTL